MRRALAILIPAAIDWALIWALGLLIVSYIDTRIGWVLIGILGGAVTSLILRRTLNRIGLPALRKGQHAVILLGWVIGGVAAAFATAYVILTGWLFLGAIGGTATAFAIGGGKPVRLFLIALGWVVGGVLGSEFATSSGSFIGANLPTLVRDTLPFLVWAVTWGIAGAIMGVIGTAVALWQMRPAE